MKYNLYDLPVCLVMFDCSVNTNVHKTLVISNESVLFEVCTFVYQLFCDTSGNNDDKTVQSSCTLHMLNQSWHVDV